MDTITAHRRSQSQTRAHLNSEWRDKRDVLNLIVRHLTSAVSALQDVPRPLFVAEATAHENASTAFAEHLGADLTDYLSNMVATIKRQVDDVGGNPGDIAIDLEHFQAACAALHPRGQDA